MKFILDTNVYRRLALEHRNNIVSEARKLKIAETNAKSNSVCSVVVAAELITHLIEGDNEKADCYYALCFLSEHTLWYDAQKKVLFRDCAYPLNNILTKFFGNKNSQELPFYDSILKLMEVLVDKAAIENCLKYQGEIKQVKEYLYNFRNEFRLNVEAYLREINNGELDWKMFYNPKNTKIGALHRKHIKNGNYFLQLAISLMKRGYKDLGYDTDKLNIERFENFIKKFKPAIIYNLKILNSVGNSEQMEAAEDYRWNDLMDMQLLFQACEKVNDKCTIVTEDDKFRNWVIDRQLYMNIWKWQTYQKCILQ